MCDAGCVCSQLNAEPILTNEKLLNFDVSSKDIDWDRYIVSLRPRGKGVLLNDEFELMTRRRSEPDGDNCLQTLVMHDMMGNYLEDKYFHSSKKYDDYRFFHWAGIDYFNYFSHNYVTIPPSGWINAAHRHGVKVLGTFITENEAGIELLKEVLSSKTMIKKIVDALVRLCTHYKFDGWLINIECKVDEASMENLHYFMSRLRTTLKRKIEHGVIFWYDSIIATGAVKWQNEINMHNLAFYHNCDGMLVNYNWVPFNLINTAAKLNPNKRPHMRVFFGIDVFGRGQLGKFQCVVKLKDIKENHFSTGIFAPAWTYETLTNYGYDIKQKLGNDEVNSAFLIRNDRFWAVLWEYLTTYPYCHIPFYTDFCLGSGKNTYERGLIKTTGDEGRTLTTTVTAKASTSPKTTTTMGDKHEEVSISKTAAAAPTSSAVGTSDTTSVDPSAAAEAKDDACSPFFNLSRQSLQPSVPLYKMVDRCYNDAFNGGSCLHIISIQKFRIFTTDFHITTGGLVVAYAYKCPASYGELDLLVRFYHEDSSHDCCLNLGKYGAQKIIEKGQCFISAFNPKYNHLLSTLECMQIPKEMARDDSSENGWNVRYYVVEFDVPVIVADVGVEYRKKERSKDTAYLGAVYINQYNTDVKFPEDSKKAYIKLNGTHILNNT